MLMMTSPTQRKLLVRVAMDSDNRAIYDRLLKLEIEVKKDGEANSRETALLRDQLSLLSKDYHRLTGEMRSISEMVSLYKDLAKDLKEYRHKQEQDHKEVMGLLAKKLDSDRPAKWALNFQTVVKYLFWAIALLTAFGFGNMSNLIPSI